MNLYILMPWGMVEVKDVGRASFGQGGTTANVMRPDGQSYAAYVDSAKFPIILAEEAPTITRVNADKS